MTSMIMVKQGGRPCLHVSRRLGPENVGTGRGPRPGSDVLTNGLNRNKKRSVSLGFTVLPWILDSFFGF